MIKYIVLVVILSFSILKAEVTPNEVFIEAKSIKLAIASMVNKDVGVSLLPVIDIDLKSAKPLNSYAMAMALNEKIRLQMFINGIKGWSTKEYPKEKIAPKDLYELMLVIQENLKKLNSSITFKKDSATNKMPPDVMQELVIANLWMDKFVGAKSTPSYSYQIIKKIEHEVKMMMAKLNLKELKPNFQKYPTVTPKDAFINAQNVYSILASFDKVKFGNDNPLRPYDILSAEVNIRPIDVFTISNYILNYLYSIKKALGFEIDFYYSPELQDGIKPNDIYLIYDEIHYMLIQILANLGDVK